MHMPRLPPLRTARAINMGPTTAHISQPTSANPCREVQAGREGGCQRTKLKQNTILGVNHGYKASLDSSERQKMAAGTANECYVKGRRDTGVS